MASTFTFKKAIQSLLYYSICSAAVPLFSMDRQVTTTADDGSTGSLRQVINATNGSGGAPGDTITFTVGGTITLASPLTPITQQNVVMNTNGNAITLNGGGTYSGLFIWPTAQSFILNNTVNGSFTSLNTASIGGSGGTNAGGALGAGGGIFVPAATEVTIQGITLTNCKATGGAGGPPNSGGGGFLGGGGGMSSSFGGTVTGGTAGGGGGGGFGMASGGGGSGDSGGGGGGIGVGNSGGNSLGGTVEGAGGGSDAGAGGNAPALIAGNGSTGTSGSGGGGGGGVNDGGASGTGSSGGGGAIGGFLVANFGGNGGPILGGFGGANPGTTGTSGGGGGGVGGGGGGTGGNGGAGGYSGGGGGGGEVAAAVQTTGGAGGFGGGGGAGSNQGGAGGFGGGGGSYTTMPGTAGAGGGNFGGHGGSSPGLGGGGGGGAGLGGAIFIDQTGYLTVRGLIISGSTISGGAAGDLASGSLPGEASGIDIFIRATGTMNFAQSNTVTLSSSNSINSDTATGGGAGGIVMSGTGILVFGAQNFYAGSTDFEGGTTQVSADNQLGLSQNPLYFGTYQGNGTLEITANGFSSARSVQLGTFGGTIETDPSVTATFSGPITNYMSQTGALTKSGTGTLVLSDASNTYSGGTNFTAGTVQISSPGDLGNSSGVLTFTNAAILEFTAGFATNTLSSPITLGGSGTGSGGTLQTDTGVTATLSGAITGNGQLTKQGTGTLTLSGTSNTYHGQTNLLVGTVASAASNNLSPNSVVSFSGASAGASLNVTAGSGTTNTIGGLTGGTASIGSVMLGANILALNTSTSLSYGGSITGSTGGITKTGGGTQTLTGTANVYSGLTTINQGTLAAGATNALSATSIVTFSASDPTATLTISGFNNTVAGLAGGGVSAGTVNLGANTLTINNTTASSFAGAISGTGGITKTGTAPQTFTGVGRNIYQGVTTIDAGTLTAGAMNALSPNSIVTLLNVAGATLNITANNQIAGLSGGGTTGGNVTTSGILTLGNNRTATSYAGAITGTGGITKTATQSQTLTGSNLNTYSGTTTISQGTLVAGGGDVLSPNSIVAFTNNSGTLDMSGMGDSNTIAGLSGPGGNVLLGANTLSLENTTNTSYGGGITGAGGVTLATSTMSISQTLTGGGRNTYSGPTIINLGTLTGAGGNALSPNSIVLLSNTPGATLNILEDNQIAGLSIGGTAGGNVTLTRTLTLGNNTTATSYAGAITGTGGITKVGTATQTLTGGGLNTYTGFTTINAGTLQAGATNALAGSSVVSFANVSGATLNITGYDNAVGNISGGGSTGGNIILGANTLTFGANTSPTFYAGSISGTGDITKVGSGSTSLSGNNTFTGQVMISGGTLAIDEISAIDTSAGVTDNAILAFNFPGAGTYSNDIVGSGEVIKNQPSGVLTLTGTNDFGPFVINSGTVYINGGGTTTTETTIEPGALLRGNGPLAGATITNYGTVYPGNSIGTLDLIGSYIEASGSTLEIELSPQPGVTDLLNIAGTMTIDPNATLFLMPDPGMYAATSVYQIVATTGGVTGAFDNVVGNNFGLVKFNVDYRNNGIFLEAAFSTFVSAAAPGNPTSVATYLDTLTPPPGSDLAFVFNILRTLGPTQYNAALDQLDPAPYKGLSVAQQENVFRLGNGLTHHLDDFINTACRRDVDRRKNFELWADVFGDWSKQHSQHGHLGYHSKGGGALLGGDYSFTNNFLLGLAGGYTYSDVHSSESRAKGHINSYYGALYTLLHGHHLFLDLAFIGGYDQFDESRKIKFSSIYVGGIDRRAHTDHHGWNVDGHAGAGVIIDQWKALEIRPFISFDYLFLHEDGFKESGAKSLNLEVRHSDYSMLRSEAGINLARCFRGKHGLVIPEVGFSVIRENRFSGRHYRSNLVGEPGSFVVSGLYPDRTLYHPAAGLTGAFCDDRLAFSVYYDGEFGHHYSDNAGTAELSWRF